MASIMINGRRIVTSGESISVMASGNDIYVNGSKINPDDYAAKDERVFNVVIEGDVDSVSNETGSITVNGASGSVKNISGDVRVAGSVTGSVSAVSGDVSVQGDIGGSVSTISGDIHEKRF